MKILYKILFEVKVLHEYYHTDSNRQSVFDTTIYKTQQDRINFLDTRFMSDRPSVSNNLFFLLSPTTHDDFRGRHMVLLQSYSGFQVAVSVNEVVVNGVTAYKPAVPIEDNFNIVVLMYQASGQFSRLSNGRSQRNIPSLYYFSNEKITDAKTAPSLSNPIAAKDNNYLYEQGELYKDGADIRMYYKDTTNTDNYIKAIGDGYANETDRLVISPRFDYTFEKTANVTNAKFSLKDQQGGLLREITASGQPLSKVSLNFKADKSLGDEYTLVTLPKAAIADHVLYSLEVTGDGGYSKKFNLIFYEAVEELGPAWGVIQIQTKVSDNIFNLLDANGNINTPTWPGETIARPYPIFEIRCKSRFTFWKYSNDTGAALQLTGNLQNFLTPATNASQLVSLAPFPSTFFPYYINNLKDPNDHASYFLPNPSEDTIIEASNNQLFSNILVPNSKLFPIV